MATFIAAAAAASAPVAASRIAGQPVTVYSEYAIGAALALNDLIRMVKMPAGARVLGVTLGADDLDTGGSPAITLDVGDDADPDRYVAASTIGQTGAAPTGAILKAGFGYVYSEDDTIDILVKAAPATGATTGTLRLAATYVTP
jgi:hypothetical protein